MVGNRRFALYIRDHFASVWGFFIRQGDRLFCPWDRIDCVGCTH